MSKIKKLNLEYLPDLVVMGVFSPQKDYRLCWLLQKHLGMDFQRLKNFEVQLPKWTEPADVAMFRYRSHSHYMHYYLVANKTPQGSLFELPANLDYLVLVHRPGDQFRPEDLIVNFRKIPQISMAIDLAPWTDQPWAKNLLFDFEMHLEGG